MWSISEGASESVYKWYNIDDSTYPTIFLWMHVKSGVLGKITQPF